MNNGAASSLLLPSPFSHPLPHRSAFRHKCVCHPTTAAPAAPRTPQRRRPRAQEVREDDVRDARGAQLGLGARAPGSGIAAAPRAIDAFQARRASSRSAAYHSSRARSASRAPSERRPARRPRSPRAPRRGARPGPASGRRRRPAWPGPCAFVLNRASTSTPSRPCSCWRCRFLTAPSTAAAIAVHPTHWSDFHTDVRGREEGVDGRGEPTRRLRRVFCDRTRHLSYAIAASSRRDP